MQHAPLNGDGIRELLAQLADELRASSAQHRLVLVGGSLLALHGLRDATLDVDSIEQLNGELLEAAARVARARNLAPSWLNDRAALFTPAGLEVDRCEVLAEHPRLLVLGASFEDVFCMKLYRANPNDLEDLVTIWPRTAFNDGHEAAEAFRAAFPHAPEDEHLASFIDEIASRSR